MAFLAKAKQVLETQLADLKVRLEHIETDLAEPMDADSSERAVQMEDDESLEGQAAVIENRITATQRALLRVADGTYGECMQCGEEISQGRLDARPESTLCVDCKSAG